MLWFAWPYIVYLWSHALHALILLVCRFVTIQPPRCLHCVLFNREHGVMSLEANFFCGRKINVIMVMAALRMNLEKVPDDELICHIE